MKDPIHFNAVILLRSSLDAGNTARLRVDGESMRPTLQKGDVVIVYSCPMEQLSIGDVLVMQRDNELVTHRLVSIQPDGWYTKGDAYSTLDPLFSRESILGRVEAVERGESSWSIRTPGWISSSRIVGWMAWQEAQAYRFYRRLTVGGGEGKKWWAQLLLIPFRLPLWLLAAYRR